MSEDIAARAARLRAFHREQTGVDAAVVYQAPGRVNLLGEHTDYSGGFCMPAALNFNTLVAVSGRGDGVLRVHSIDFGETAEIALEQLRVPAQLPAGAAWSSYCFGVAWSLMERGIVLSAAELSLSGNVPLSAGLSSSASVEVGVASALLGFATAELGKVEIAVACQRAENVYVGAPSGIMDQYISTCGVRDHALAIDTRALTAELAPVPESLRLVIANSMVKHANAGAEGPYAGVRRDIEQAAAVLAGRNPGVRQLRDATLGELDAARGEMPEMAFRRARHVITDSQRVLDGLAALRAGDTAAFGRLMTTAHASMRDDLQASCAACDQLVALAMTLPGCLGSRLTGGGFGGCTVSLVEAEAAEEFAAGLQAGFRAKSGVVADVFVCEIADGAGLLEA